MHAFDFIIYLLAAAVTVVAYLRDPSLPAVGFRAGQGSSHRAIFAGFVAGILTPGGRS